MIADLVLLAADKTIETGVARVFARSQSLGCRTFTFRRFVHPGRDPGCYRKAAEFLTAQSNQYQYALVIFDREGSGTTKQREDAETEVEARLAASGWNDRVRCIVVDPEIENWVWTDSPHVARCLRWEGNSNPREWLASHGLWPPEAVKPPRPKEALEKILRVTGQVRSSSIYGELAQRVSLARCSDPAFLKLRELLLNWFSAA